MERKLGMQWGGGSSRCCAGLQRAIAAQLSAPLPHGPLELGQRLCGMEWEGRLPMAPLARMHRCALDVGCYIGLLRAAPRRQAGSWRRASIGPAERVDRHIVARSCLRRHSHGGPLPVALGVSVAMLPRRSASTSAFAHRRRHGRQASDESGLSAESSADRVRHHGSAGLLLQPPCYDAPVDGPVVFMRAVSTRSVMLRLRRLSSAVAIRKGRPRPLRLLGRSRVVAGRRGPCSD